MLEAADLAVAEAVVVEGEHALGDGDLGDLAAAAVGDPLGGSAERAAALNGFLGGLDQRSVDVRRALLGDVAEPCLAVGGADRRGEAGRALR
jgi:hypothetical protein